MNKDKLLWLLGVLALVLIVAWGIWYYYAVMSTPVYTTTNTSISVLTKSNSAFAKAEALKKVGDYAGAIASYQAALTTTTDAVQIGRIKLNLAFATARSGDVVGAIQLDKQVAADTQGLPRVRAYSIEDMGRLYYGSLDTSITNEIFKEEPYKSMFVPGDDALSYRKLFDYAASLNPLAVSEYYRSNWYANRILALQKNKTASSSAEIEASLALINEQFKAADSDITFRKSDPDTSATAPIPAALLRKAVTIGTLSYAGLASSTAAESAYKDALAAYNSYASTVGSDGFARYSYARFLARAYGNRKITDIKDLLQPLYTDSRYTILTATFFKNARFLDSNNGTKNNIQALARLDAGFKGYLIASLGWKTSDF